MTTFGNNAAARLPTQHDFARVKSQMLDRLWNIFGEPKALDLDAFANEYVKALCKFDDQQLHEGCDELFRTMKFTKWPTPHECIQACNIAARAIYARQNPKPVTRPAGDEYKRSADERRSLEMMRGPIAERAARDKWLLGLRDFVRDQGRLPTADEERNLVDAAAFVRDCAAGHVDMGMLHEGLARMAHTAMRRNEELRQALEAENV